MKYSIVFAILALSSSVLSAPKSENELVNRSSDQCKSVTAIISILSQHKASATSFCSSYISVPVKTVTSTNVITLTSKTSTVTQTKTITPRISITATTTVTPTVAPILTQAIGKRDLQERDPSPIPTYLTAFSPSKISSACSCFSITPSTTTLKITSTTSIPAATVTVRTTITKPPITTTVSEVVVTASTTVTECGMPQPTFILKMASPVVVNGTQLQGTYGTVHVDYEDIGSRIDRFAFNGLTDLSAAGVLWLTQSPGFLVGFESGFLAVRLLNETGVQALHFEDPEGAGSEADAADVCSINEGVLACTRTEATILQLCPETSGFNDLFLGPTVGSGCSEVVLDVVPVCTPAPAPAAMS